MYSFFRQIHLWCAFVLAVFVGMYFVTGYVLSHAQWFGNPEPVKSTRIIESGSFRDLLSPDPVLFAARLQEKLKISGKPEPARHLKDGRWEFKFHHPGSLVSVILSANFTSGTISEEHYAWQRTMIGLHRLHGYGGGWMYDLWALLYDLASIAMIVFALSGIWLWFKLSKNRLPGWILLGFGFIFTFSTILYLLVVF